MMLVLPEGAKGVPDMNARTTKILEEHIPFVPSKREINEETGKRLAEWANPANNKAHVITLSTRKRINTIPEEISS